MFVATGIALAGSLALGASARAGLTLGRWRWLHHALFFLVVAAAGVTFVIDLVDGSWRAVPMAALLAVLAGLPATSGGSRAHVGVGLLAAAAYTAAVVVASSI